MSRPPEDDFLSRWSRRKRAVAEEEITPPQSEAEPAAADEVPSDETDEELLARLDLPDPESLEQGDDFSRFMASAVPEHLRRRALRRLWRSNPTFAVLDGLNEYDEDYTKGFVPAGTLKTAYKVGRGFLSRLDEEDETRTDETPDAEPATNAPDKNAQETDVAPDPPSEEVLEDPEPAADPLEDTRIATSATRRRMQFRMTPSD